MTVISYYHIDCYSMSINTRVDKKIILNKKEDVERTLPQGYTETHLPEGTR